MKKAKMDEQQQRRLTMLGHINEALKRIHARFYAVPDTTREQNQ
jgi:hypothetical protein